MSESVSPNLVSYRGAERILGVHRQTVSDLVARLGIVPKSVPTNGNAKGLDPADVERIRTALDAISIPA